MKKAILLTTLAAAIAIGGVFSGWFFRGFSATELEQLERDWAQVVAWADLQEADPVIAARTQEFIAAVKAAELPDELFNQAKETRLSRSELTPEVLALLLRFEAHLAKGDLGPMPPDASALAHIQIGDLELSMDDMDAERMGQFLTWSRNLGESSSLMGQMVASTLSLKALERCRSEPKLLPTSVPVPPPSVEESFFALCRDLVHADHRLTQGKTSYKDIHGAANSELKFTAHIMRRAFANTAIDLYPRRKTAKEFVERPRTDMPGELESWFLSKFGSHENYTDRIENYIASARSLSQWATFVKTWNEVLGS